MSSAASFTVLFKQIRHAPRSVLFKQIPPTIPLCQHSVPGLSSSGTVKALTHARIWSSRPNPPDKFVFASDNRIEQLQTISGREHLQVHMDLIMSLNSKIMVVAEKLAATLQLTRKKRKKEENG